MVVEKEGGGGIFWQGVVDSGRVDHIEVMGPLSLGLTYPSTVTTLVTIRPDDSIAGWKATVDHYISQRDTNLLQNFF